MIFYISWEFKFVWFSSAGKTERCRSWRALSKLSRWLYQSFTETAFSGFINFDLTLIFFLPMYGYMGHDMIGFERVDAKNRISFFLDNNGQLMIKLIEVNRMNYLLRDLKNLFGARASTFFCKRLVKNFGNFVSIQDILNLYFHAFWLAESVGFRGWEKSRQFRRSVKTTHSWKGIIKDEFTDVVQFGFGIATDAGTSAGSQSLFDLLPERGWSVTATVLILGKYQSIKPHTGLPPGMVRQQRTRPFSWPVSCLGDDIVMMDGHNHDG